MWPFTVAISRSLWTNLSSGSLLQSPLNSPGSFSRYCSCLTGLTPSVICAPSFWLCFVGASQAHQLWTPQHLPHISSHSLPSSWASDLILTCSIPPKGGAFKEVIFWRFLSCTPGLLLAAVGSFYRFSLSWFHCKQVLCSLKSSLWDILEGLR